MEHVTDSLYKDINEMHVRSNVDSAKKLACLQHMDYAGFSQMVLGANLFPMKAGQVTNIVKGGTTKINNLNHTAIYDNIVKSKVDVGYDEQVVRNTLGMIGDERFETPKNPVELDKQLSKKYSNSM